MGGPFKINLEDDWMYSHIRFPYCHWTQITQTVQQLLLPASHFDTTKPHPQLPPLSPEMALIGAVIF